MGVAKQLFIVVEIIVWLGTVGAILLGSPIDVAMGGSGLFPSASVSGLGSLPVVTLGLTTGGFLVLVVLTQVLMP